MPRPNKPRQVTYEARLAQRIQHEREARGLTYERLAEKVTDAGCPMQGSAIFKIEKGSPPRRITVNELVTLAQVFGLRVTELLVPLELAAKREVLAAFEEWSDAFAKRQTVIAELDAEMAAAAKRVGKAVGGNEAAEDALRDELVARFGESSHWVDDLMEDFRG